MDIICVLHLLFLFKHHLKMDKIYLDVLKEFGIQNFEQLDGFLIERDALMNDEVYKRVSSNVSELKQYFSSSLLTSLQVNAEAKQRFPLVNFIRQLLRAKFYNMEPIRKANGYDKSGKKLYKRYFLIKKMPQ